jgi:hypothetical protein
MLKVFLAAAAALMLAACASGVTPENNWREAGYDRESELVAQQRKSNSITVLQANRRMSAVAKTYFPNDDLLIQTWDDLVALAEQVEHQTITKDEYEQLRQMRWRLFDDANLQRHNEAKQLEAQQRRSAFMASFASGMARATQRNNQQPINCSTTSMPGVVNTTCR